MVLMAMPKNWWKKEHCWRCKAKFKSKDEARVGYGHYIFCPKCEESFKKWLDRERKE